MGSVVYFVQEKLNGMISLPLELVSLVLLGAATYGATALLFQAAVHMPQKSTMTICMAVLTLPTIPAA